MKKFRLYLDKDKEEVWINEMCKKGYAMKHFFLGVYTFAPCEKGEYIYRIDLLQNWEGDKQDFVSFMQEMEVEFVSQWYRWIFLRKKANDGAFELYSDADSMIQQYARIKKFFFVAMIIELWAGFMQLPSIFVVRHPLNVGVAILALLVSAMFFSMILKCNKKIRQCRQR